MNVILFGFKRCGKTHYGLKLAHHLHMHFLDTDHLVEQRYLQIHKEPLPYRDIVKKHGFAFFRQLEKEVLLSIAHVKNTVIAVGGGVVLDPENVERLQKIGMLIYLKTDKETLKKRILSHDPPAYFDPEHPVESFETMYETRLPIYEQVQAHWIDTAKHPEETVLQKIVYLIQSAQDEKNGQQ